jgi:hypothetical protein
MLTHDLEIRGHHGLKQVDIILQGPLRRQASSHI